MEFTPGWGYKQNQYDVYTMSTLESLGFTEMPQRTYIFLKITVLTPIGTVKKKKNSVSVCNTDSGGSAPRQSHR